MTALVSNVNQTGLESRTRMSQLVDKISSEKKWKQITQITGVICTIIMIASAVFAAMLATAFMPLMITAGVAAILAGVSWIAYRILTKKLETDLELKGNSLTKNLLDPGNHGVIRDVINKIPDQECAELIELAEPLMQRLKYSSDRAALLEDILLLPNSDRAEVVQLAASLIHDLKDKEHRTSIVKLLLLVPKEQRAKFVKIAAHLLHKFSRDYQKQIILEAILEIPLEERAEVIKLLNPFLLKGTTEDLTKKLLQAIFQTPQLIRQHIIDLVTPNVQDLLDTDLRNKLLTLLLQISERDRSKFIEKLKPIIQNFNDWNNRLKLLAIPFDEIDDVLALGMPLLEDMPKPIYQDIFGIILRIPKLERKLFIQPMRSLKFIVPYSSRLDILEVLILIAPQRRLELLELIRQGNLEAKHLLQNAYSNTIFLRDSLEYLLEVLDNAIDRKQKADDLIAIMDRHFYLHGAPPLRKEIMSVISLSQEKRERIIKAIEPLTQNLDDTRKHNIHNIIFATTQNSEPQEITRLIKSFLNKSGSLDDVESCLRVICDIQEDERSRVVEWAIRIIKADPTYHIRKKPHAIFAEILAISKDHREEVTTLAMSLLNNSPFTFEEAVEKVLAISISRNELIALFPLLKSLVAILSYQQRLGIFEALPLIPPSFRALLLEGIKKKTLNPEHFLTEAYSNKLYQQASLQYLLELLDQSVERSKTIQALTLKFEKYLGAAYLPSQVHRILNLSQSEMAQLYKEAEPLLSKTKDKASHPKILNFIITLRPEERTSIIISAAKIFGSYAENQHIEILKAIREIPENLRSLIISLTCDFIFKNRNKIQDITNFSFEILKTIKEIKNSREQIVSTVTKILQAMQSGSWEARRDILLLAKQDNFELFNEERTTELNKVITFIQSLPLARRYGLQDASLEVKIFTSLCKVTQVQRENFAILLEAFLKKRQNCTKAEFEELFFKLLSLSGTIPQRFMAKVIDYMVQLSKVTAPDSDLEKLLESVLFLVREQRDQIIPKITTWLKSSFVIPEILYEIDQIPENQRDNFLVSISETHYWNTPLMPMLTHALYQTPQNQRVELVSQTNFLFKILAYIYHGSIPYIDFVNMLSSFLRLNQTMRAEAVIRIGRIQNPNYVLLMTLLYEYKDRMPTYSLVVDREELQIDPLKILNTLCSQFSVGCRDGLKISFENDPGQDQGGLSRQFLADLFEGIVNKLGFEKLDNGLHRPYLKATSSIEERNAYKQLGQLIMFCLNAQEKYPIGMVFDISFFKALTKFNDSLISNFINKTEKKHLLFTLLAPIYASMLENNHHLQLWLKTQDSYSDEELLLAYGFIQDDTRLEKKNLDSNIVMIKDNRDLILGIFREYILKNHILPHLQPMLEIAMGMRAAPFGTKKSWSDILTSEADELSVELQGIFSRETLLQKLVFNNVPAEKQNWLKEWINKADEQKIKQFLYAVTGSPAIGNLKIDIVNTEKDQVIFTTCFFRLSFPFNTIASQKDFITLLEHSIMGKEFSTA